MEVEKIFQRIVGNDLAALIGPGLAKDAVAMSVNGEQRDLSNALADGIMYQLLL